MYWHQSLQTLESTSCTNLTELSISLNFLQLSMTISTSSTGLLSEDIWPASCALTSNYCLIKSYCFSISSFKMVRLYSLKLGYMSFSLTMFTILNFRIFMFLCSFAMNSRRICMRSSQTSWSEPLSAAWEAMSLLSPLLGDDEALAWQMMKRHLSSGSTIVALVRFG